MKTLIPRVFLCGLLGVSLLTAQAGLPIHQYLFQNDLQDSIGTVDLVNNGGTVGAGYLSFEKNQGPSLYGEKTLAGTYSIGLKFELTEVSGYRKLIDFKDLSSDYGQYVYYGQLKVYAPGFPPQGGTVNAGSLTELVCTRDWTSGKYYVYLNGSSTPVNSYDDTGSYFSATTVGETSIFHFFRDDVQTGYEASAGTLYEMRIWDYALAPWEIPNAFAPIPEPGEHALLAGLVLLVFACWFRRGGKRAASKV